MMGFRHDVLSSTKGNATINSIFCKYEKIDQTSFSGLKKGKLVSMETGKATGYALMSVEERGKLFLGVGEETYEGMVIGENAKTGDLDVNPCKLKKLTNIRSTGAEEKVALSPPIKMVCLIFCLFVCLFVCLFIFMSVCLFFSLFVCL